MPGLTSLNRNLAVLHLTVFVWGFTGVLGALISISAVHLVWYRVLIAFITLFLYFISTKKQYKVSKSSFLKLISTGAIVAAHWILFFYSIKASTVSVTLVCLSSITLFTALLEPLFYRRQVSKLEIMTGLLIIAGIYLIFEFESQYTEGIIAGLASAFCASLFSIINSKQIKNHDAPIISFYEMLGAWFWISAYLFATNGFSAQMQLNSEDLVYLLILGTVCTSIAYVAGVSVMKELSAFRVALVTNLEPLYGIVLAFLFLGRKEHMSSEFYVGASIILAAIFLYPIIRNRIEKRALIKRTPTE